MTLTDDHKGIILHALGVSVRGRVYRDHYYTTIGDPRLEGLVSMGLMQRGGIMDNGRNQYYFVTEAGAAAVGHKLASN